MGMGVFVRQYFDVFGHWCAAIENRRLDSWHVFAETVIFVLDLIGQFASMAHDEDRTLARDRFDLLKCSEDEHGCFTET